MSIYEKYEPYHKILLAFWLLQCQYPLFDCCSILLVRPSLITVAPILESVIHIDRVFYLLEHGIRSEIYNLFDRNLSPRSLVLVASKER